jgi:hypothetical protein
MAAVPAGNLILFLVSAVTPINYAFSLWNYRTKAISSGSKLSAETQSKSASVSLPQVEAANVNNN